MQQYHQHDHRNRQPILNQQQVGSPNNDLPLTPSFVFNNMTSNTVAAHAQYVIDRLTTDTQYRKLAHYLVMRRTPMEPNYHEIYFQFMTLINNKCFTDSTLYFTYYFVKSLLRSPTMAQSNSDRTCLRNLGHWLGMITLQRDRPILTIEIDVKFLVIEASIKGRDYLRFVLPFVAKVLEPSINSKVSIITRFTFFKIFHPPNPWVMSMLGLLKEVQALNRNESRFTLEVDVLLKNLKVAEDVSILVFLFYFKSVPKTTYLSNKEDCLKLLESYEQMNPNLNKGPISSGSVGPQGSTAVAGFAAVLMDEDIDQKHCERPVSITPIPETQPQQTVCGYSPRYTILDIKSYMDIHTIAAALDINANIPALVYCPQIRQYIAATVFKTINEILPGLLERASKIALSTTESLIKKDFSICTNENLVRSCAHNMVGHLVSGLVLIGGREQLFRQMILNLQQVCSDHFLRRRNLTESNTNQPINPSYSDEMCKDCSLTLAKDNIDQCVCVMAKVAMHRSMQELEKRLLPMYEIIRRNKHSSNSQLALSLQSNERLPEALKIRPEMISGGLLSNYHQFAKSISGFSDLPNDVTPDLLSIEFVNLVDRLLAEFSTLLTYLRGNGCTEKSARLQSVRDVYKNILSRIEALHNVIHTISINHNYQTEFASDILNLTNNILVHSCMCFMELYEEQTLNTLSSNTISHFQDCFFAVFRHLVDTNVLGPAWNNRSLARALAQRSYPFRNNLLAIPLFIKFKLMSLSELDFELRNEFRDPNVVHEESLSFAINLIRYCLLECANSNQAPTGNSSNAVTAMAFNLSELQHTLEALQRASILNPKIDDYVWNVLEVVRVNYDIHHLNDQLRSTSVYRPLLGVSVLYSALAQVRTDCIRTSINPAQFAEVHESTIFLFERWISIHRSIPSTNEFGQRETHDAFANYVMIMNEQGIFKSDERINGFFRGLVQICITRAYDLICDPTIDKQDKENELENGRFHQPSLVCHLSSTSIYHELYEVCDAFAKLVVMLIRHSGEPRNIWVRASLVNKVLGLISGCCLIDADVRKEEFCPVPYQRMFLTLFRELNAASFLSDSTYYAFTQSLMSAYFLLNPLICPAFTFAWIELIGHGPFMGRVLQSTNQIKNSQCWSMYNSLLVALLKFINPFIVGTDNSSDWITFTYKCVLRIFLVILHDFPEFLVEFAYDLLEHVPVRCIQLRNVILSAFPRQMKLPDPLNQLLKIDLLAEINITPPMHYNFHYRIQPALFKTNLDNYLTNRTPQTFLTTLKDNLTDINTNAYNVRVLYAVVFYVGIRAIEHMIRRQEHISTESIGDCASMDIYETLLTELDWEGRYFLVNALANHIRFPNCQTHYFSCVILHLFCINQSMTIKEQIVRVLAERLIVNRPHPWGLLVAFAELVRNKNYRLMECPFVFKIPEMQRLFESAGSSSPYGGNNRGNIRSGTTVTN